MTTFKGTIAKQPIIKDKVIFSAIKMSNETNPVQIVLFKSTVDNKFVELLSSLKLNDEITVAGKMQNNKLNNQREIVIAELYNGHEAPKDWRDAYAIDPNRDFVVGGETEHGIISKEGNPLKERIYFTDGEHYWYEDSEIKTPCFF